MNRKERRPIEIDLSRRHRHLVSGRKYANPRAAAQTILPAVTSRLLGFFAHLEHQRREKARGA